MSRILLWKFAEFFSANSFSGISVISDTKDNSAQVSKIVEKISIPALCRSVVAERHCCAAGGMFLRKVLGNTRPLEGNSPLDSRIPAFWNVARAPRPRPPRSRHCFQNCRTTRSYLTFEQRSLPLGIDESNRITYTAELRHKESRVSHSYLARLGHQISLSYSETDPFDIWSHVEI